MRGIGGVRFMSSEQDIARALRALAGADAEVEASPALEGRVVRDYRHRLKRVPPVLSAWRRLQPAVALAAAAILIAFAIVARRPAHHTTVVTQAPRVMVPAVSSPPLPPAAKAQPARRPPLPREIMTPFFPLIDDPPPVDRGELLRVTVPAATMRNVGLPVAEDRLGDRVQADVLVSEEGFATAIRFVKYE